MLNMMKNILNDENIKTNTMPFRLQNISDKISLRCHLPNEENFDDYYLNMEKTAMWTAIQYWIQLIEYDLSCLYCSLIYLESIGKELERSNLFMENIDVYFSIDCAVGKYISLMERVLQLVNCTFSLGLVENQIGQNSVTFTNVIKRLKAMELFDVKVCISKLKSSEMMEIKKVRNRIVHTIIQ